MHTISHAGVLPYRINAGKAKYLLITGRRSGRWIIPKGHHRRDRDVRETALIEGFEEAGLEGTIGREPLGAFRDRSGGKRDTVLVYPLRVARQARSWPEKNERMVKWFDVDEAIANVQRELGKLIQILDARISKESL